MTNFHARNAQKRQELRRDAHTWLVIFIVFAILLSIFMFAPAPAEGSEGGYDAEQNHPSYWGDDCVKTEQALQGPRWYTPVNEGYRLVVLKSGTTNDVFENVPADTQLTTNSGKDISHVIYCGPTPTPTTTVPVLPTAPPTTSTAPTSTQSVPPTTVPPSTTPTVPVPPVPVMPTPTPVPHTPAFTG